MFSSIKEAFVITGRELILTQPLMTFIIVFLFLSGGLFGAKTNIIAFIIFALSLSLLCIAFMAGWLFLTKKIIDFVNDNDYKGEERFTKSCEQIKYFFPGVGEYFLSLVGFCILYLVFSGIVAFVVFKIGVHKFGVLDIDIRQFYVATSSVVAMREYLGSLSDPQLFSLVRWFSVIPFVAAFIQMLTMWWVPALYYKTKNPLLAFVEGVKFFFKKLFPSMGIFFLLFLGNYLVSTFSKNFYETFWGYILGFVFLIFYLTYYVVLIFLYYEKHSKNIQTPNNFDSGFDIDGQKLAGSDDSKQA